MSMVARVEVYFLDQAGSGHVGVPGPIWPNNSGLTLMAWNSGIIARYLDMKRDGGIVRYESLLTTRELHVDRHRSCSSSELPYINVIPFVSSFVLA